MHLPTPEAVPDTPEQRRADKRRWLRAFNTSLAFVLVLLAVFSAQGHFDVAAWTVQPWSVEGLRGSSPRRCCTVRSNAWRPMRSRC